MKQEDKNEVFLAGILAAMILTAYILVALTH